MASSIAQTVEEQKMETQKTDDNASTCSSDFHEQMKDDSLLSEQKINVTVVVANDDEVNTN